MSFIHSYYVFLFVNLLEIEASRNFSFSVVILPWNRSAMSAISSRLGEATTPDTICAFPILCYRLSLRWSEPNLWSLHRIYVFVFCICTIASAHSMKDVPLLPSSKYSFTLVSGSIQTLCSLFHRNSCILYWSISFGVIFRNSMMRDIRCGNKFKRVTKYTHVAQFELWHWINSINNNNYSTESKRCIDKCHCCCTQRNQCWAMTFSYRTKIWLGLFWSVHSHKYVPHIQIMLYDNNNNNNSDEKYLVSGIRMKCEPWIIWPWGYDLSADQRHRHLIFERLINCVIN